MHLVNKRNKTKRQLEALLQSIGCSPDQTPSLSRRPPPSLPSKRWPPSRTLYDTGCVCLTGWPSAPPSCRHRDAAAYTSCILGETPADVSTHPRLPALDVRLHSDVLCLSWDFMMMSCLCFRSSRLARNSSSSHRSYGSRKRHMSVCLPDPPLQ